MKAGVVVFGQYEKEERLDVVVEVLMVQEKL